MRSLGKRKRRSQSQSLSPRRATRARRSNNHWESSRPPTRLLLKRKSQRSSILYDGTCACLQLIVKLSW
jgi:hypothetical protein